MLANLSLLLQEESIHPGSHLDDIPEPYEVLTLYNNSEILTTGMLLPVPCNSSRSSLIKLVEVHVVEYISILLRPYLWGYVMRFPMDYDQSMGLVDGYLPVQ